ncbi:MAG: nitrilase [Gammaproteobacteria bacterium]|nr:nitrilase [Gammaproteobacteria bacterium]
MNQQSPEAYQALALQMRCPAINRLSVDEARGSMLQTIAHAMKLIAGSCGFLRSFTGRSTLLVVLPEYFLSGFPLVENIESWQAKGCVAMVGPEYEALSTIAQSMRIFLSGNLYELDANFPELYFQTSFIIDPSGEVVLRYRRLLSMFAPTPHDVLDASIDHDGREALCPVAETAIGRLACVASEEILYPEIARAHVLRGAEVLCHSSSEVGSPQSTPKNIAKQARAYENMVYVVSANSAGISGTPFPEASTDGHSQVVDYSGHVLGEASPGESMCGNGEIDLGALRRARRQPGMTNTLARQRLELFREVYGNQSVYPANSLDGVSEPKRAHFNTTLTHTIEALAEKGII